MKNNRKKYLFLEPCENPTVDMFIGFDVCDLADIATCQEDPNLIMACPKNCGLCGKKSQTDNQNIIKI